MYEMKTSIRTSQVDKDGLLKTSAIFDLMQDCSFFHLDTNLGIMEYFNKNNIGMFIAFRQVDIYSRPKYSEDITVRTFMYDCNPSYGYRNTVIYDKNDKELCICYVIGAFVDLDKLNLIRIDDDLVRELSYDKKQDMNYLPRKISFDNSEIIEVDRFRVKKYFIDDNNHVNNARYIDMAIDYVDDYYKRVRIEYKKPAMLNDIIIVKVKRIGDSIFVRLDGEDNISYAILEFYYGVL